VLVVLVLGGLAAGLWLAPSGQYVLLPDKAQPVAPLVKVPEDAAQQGPGGIYMVDILVRRASMLERLFPALNEGGSLVPEEALNPVGVSDEQRRQSNRLDMTNSQAIAAAVALRALGYEVEATPSGAEISLVVPGSPAAAAKLRPSDVIVEAEGQKVETPTDLRDALANVEPGSPAKIVVRRSGGLQDFTVGTEPDENDPQRAVMGVIVQQAASIDLPVDIDINAGAIGGPSAGLAFALDIVDELGREVDKGRRIVVTGELSLDGAVEAIGGVKQKTIGAREAGADVFVVPEDNAPEAEKYADGLEIVPVSTFEEALGELGVEPVS
jgi:PDZ domain-containing protein